MKTGQGISRGKDEVPLPSVLNWPIRQLLQYSQQPTHICIADHAVHGCRRLYFSRNWTVKQQNDRNARTNLLERRRKSPTFWLSKPALINQYNVDFTCKQARSLSSAGCVGQRVPMPSNRGFEFRRMRMNKQENGAPPAEFA